MLDALFAAFAQARGAKPEVPVLDLGRMRVRYEPAARGSLLEVHCLRESKCVVREDFRRASLALKIRIRQNCLADYLTLLLHDGEEFTNFKVRIPFEWYHLRRPYQRTYFTEEFSSCTPDDVQAVLNCFYPPIKDKKAA